jgi:hypothetical protein
MFPVVFSYLGRQDVLIARPVQLFEGLAHLEFALSSGVHFSCVEEIDTFRPLSLHLARVHVFPTYHGSKLLYDGVRSQYMSHMQFVHWGLLPCMQSLTMEPF